MTLKSLEDHEVQPINNIVYVEINYIWIEKALAKKESLEKEREELYDARAES